MLIIARFCSHTKMTCTVQNVNNTSLRNNNLCILYFKKLVIQDVIPLRPVQSYVSQQTRGLKHIAQSETENSSIVLDPE